MRQSTQSRALSAKTRHKFSPGLGYIEFEPHEDPPHGAHPLSRCSPPPNAADRSIHLLLPPGGASPMAFRWVAAEKGWEVIPDPSRGKRMAFTDAYLSSHGWTYARGA